MYRTYFGLSEKPFSIAPDPTCLYMSELHREALAHLLYGIGNDCGFVLLTGEVGTGKTTVCRCLLEQIPHDTEVAYILHPKMTVTELLASICEEFGIPLPPGADSCKPLVDLLNQYLLQVHARGGKAVLIIDEAQNLDFDLLEQLRLLTNLETSERKLLQIILLGQPELREALARPQLRQLAQRITARYHLQPLSRRDTAAYIAHRLAKARSGQENSPVSPIGRRGQLFSPAVVKSIHRLSGGIPRLINVLCDRALLGVYAEGKSKVDRTVLRQAAREVFGDSPPSRRRSARWVLAGFLGLALGMAYFLLEKGLPPSFSTAAVKVQEVLREPAPVIPEPGPEAAAAREFAEVEPPAAPGVPVPLARSHELSPALSRFLAFQKLLALWGIEYQEENGEPCRLAEEQGLECLEERGSLEMLRQLNLPAVLVLTDDQGREYYAALTGLTEGKARLQVGPEQRDIPFGLLGRAWSGGFIALWKPPPGFLEAVGSGGRSAGIRWLAEQLALAAGKADEALGASALPQAEAARILKEFQATAGLVPDAIPGPHTLIRFNAAAGQQGPVLTLVGEDLNP